jgi:hypothetical protein
MCILRGIILSAFHYDGKVSRHLHTAIDHQFSDNPGFNLARDCMGVLIPPQRSSLTPGAMHETFRVKMTTFLQLIDNMLCSSGE